MRYFIPDSSDSTGGGSEHVHTGMDNDPNADAEVIDQRAGEQYPKPVEEPGRIAPDNLGDSIAYALDGSGPGPTNSTPDVSGHKPITEGVTGAGPEDEEAALRV